MVKNLGTVRKMIYFERKAINTIVAGLVTSTKTKNADDIFRKFLGSAHKISKIIMWGMIYYPNISVMLTID